MKAISVFGSDQGLSVPKRIRFDPKAENRDNSQAKKIRELEAKIRSLEKKLEHKDEIITVLKKSIGIICNP